MAGSAVLATALLRRTHVMTIERARCMGMT
jgi:hypothetical protein